MKMDDGQPRDMQIVLHLRIAKIKTEFDICEHKIFANIIKT